jgi:hypothetical protein
MDSKREDIYFDFSKDEKDYAIRYLLDAVIRSRLACGCPSNEESYDEDVNIYLAHLLFAISTTAYQKLAKKYLVMYPTDLVNIVDSADDNYIKYFIYKINADNILVHLSVFHENVKNMQNRESIVPKTPGQLSDAGRSYYEQAAHYNQRIYRKRTAVGDVLDKLSRNFEMYCSVLQITRKDFFNFSNYFKDKEFSEFIKNLNQFEIPMLLKEKQNAFLDLYNEWLKDKGNVDLKMRLNRLGNEIRQIDPGFRFGID